VSTRSKVAEVPRGVEVIEVGDAGPSSDVSRILDAQVKMQRVRPAKFN